jgi:hypothetical protein
MKIDAIYACGVIAVSFPLLAIVVILAHYCLRRLRWRRNGRLGRRQVGFCPSALALGMALQFIQVFYRPSVAHVLEARQKVDAEEDDEGEPETLVKQLNRQLRRIRRGEYVERLVLRL